MSTKILKGCVRLAEEHDDLRMRHAKSSDRFEILVEQLENIHGGGNGVKIGSILDAHFEKGLVFKQKAKVRAFNTPEEGNMKKYEN